MGGLDEWLPPASSGHRNRLIDRAGFLLSNRRVGEAAARHLSLTRFALDNSFPYTIRIRASNARTKQYLHAGESYHHVMQILVRL